MNRLTTAALSVGLLTALVMSGLPGRRVAAQTLPAEPVVTPLDLHPADMSKDQDGRVLAGAMPTVVRQGTISDPGKVAVPMVVTPSQRNADDPVNAIGQAGTGFFVGDDGTLLTAAHVVKECGRMQIISKYVPRTWVSLVASDEANDIAILKAVDRHPPAIVRVAASGPASGKLFIMGFPESAGLMVAAETWGEVENQKFPANIGELANPRELLWLSAPAVTHGFSGGPIFDPKLGAVVGIVKGEVEGGYLRLVRDMPTAGVAIGPGTSHIRELLRHEVAYSAISLVASPGDAGQDTLRRATVHVLCWH